MPDRWTSHTAQALELDPGHVLYKAQMQRLQRGLSPPQLHALRLGGAQGLEQQLEKEHEESKPEVLRRRPKVRLGWATGKQVHCWQHEDRKPE